MSFVQHYLRPGDRFLDIGANVGIYTLLAASIVGEDGHIDAFEPNNSTRQRLMEILRLNGLTDSVTVHSVAVADVAGSADFGYSDDDCQSRLRSTVDSVSSGTQVQTVRLDEYLSEHRFALAKMDIEGGEPLALRGAENMLAAGNPPAMLIEMAGYSKRFGVSTSALIAQLAEHGYQCGLYEPATRMIRYTETPWKEGSENVVATSNNHSEFVMDRLRDPSR